MVKKLVRELGLEPSWPQSQCGALPYMLLSEIGGASQIRTDNLLLAKQVHYRYATTP